jgi:hypothetical protein
VECKDTAKSHCHAVPGKSRQSDCSLLRRPFTVLKDTRVPGRTLCGRGQLDGTVAEQYRIG